MPRESRDPPFQTRIGERMSGVDNRYAVAGAKLLEDPVCGMSVPAGAPVRGEHAGKSYVFCSASASRTIRPPSSPTTPRDLMTPG